MMKLDTIICRTAFNPFGFRHSNFVHLIHVSGDSRETH